jgi:DNA-binding protein
MTENIDYKQFLLETKYCDINDPEIINITKDITRKCNGDDICSAIQIFDWVRDRIKYSFDFWNIKASETLKKKSGMCANKANLQIAMLRSVGIPAGYMVLRINKDAIRAIATDELYEKSSDIIIHVYCCVMLNGNWIGADASVDRDLYDSAYIYIPGWDHVEWNGRDHIHLPDNYIVDVSGPFASIDEYMDMPHRFMTDEIVYRSNCFIDELRTKARIVIGEV